jgi:hypothetical protein
MYGLMLWTLLAQPIADDARRADSPPPNAPPVVLDGTWTVLCLEKHGQPMKEAKLKTVSIRNNIITCNSTETHPMKVMRVEFGPDATVRVTDITKEEGMAVNAPANRDPAKSEKPMSGVCVVAKDYFAICLHDMASPDGARTSMKPAETFTSEPQTKPHFTLVLKRNND